MAKTTTEVRIDSSYYDKPVQTMSYTDVMDWTIQQLRAEVQAYAGRNKIAENAVIVYFEQVERRGKNG